MCLRLPIFTLGFSASLVSLHSSDAVSLNTNSTFSEEEEPLTLNYTPARITSNEVYWNIRLNFELLEVYIPAFIFPANSFKFSDALELLRVKVNLNRDKAEKFCSPFNGVNGFKISEFESKQIDQETGSVPGIIRSSDFPAGSEVIVDTDSYSYLVYVFGYDSRDGDLLPDILFVAKKQVPLPLDKIRNTKILETIRKLNFGPEPVVVIKNSDCINLRNLQENEDPEDSDEAKSKPL